MEAVDPRDKIIAELRLEVAQLRAQLKQNSTNSSKPPSTDPPEVKRREKKASGLKPGGQPGHKRQSVRCPTVSFLARAVSSG